MLRDHWRTWLCPFECVEKFLSLSDLRYHLHERHQRHMIEFPGPMQHLETIISHSSEAEASLAEGPCPLCHEFQITSIDDYKSHVGHHLEQLALFVLPTRDDRDDAQGFSRDRPGPLQDSNFETEEAIKLHHLAQQQAKQHFYQADTDEVKNPKGGTIGMTGYFGSGRPVESMGGPSSQSGETYPLYEQAHTLQDLESSFSGLAVDNMQPPRGAEHPYQWHSWKP